MRLASVCPISICKYRNGKANKADKVREIQGKNAWLTRNNFTVTICAPNGKENRSFVSKRLLAFTKWAKSDPVFAVCMKSQQDVTLKQAQCSKIFGV